MLRMKLRGNRPAGSGEQDNGTGRRMDRTNTKNVYPVVKVVSVATKFVAEA